MAQLICEHSDCSNDHSFEESHSTIAVLQRVDTDGYTFYQCEGGQQYDGVSWQHYHCSHDHMVAGFSVCVKEHYKEEYLHSIPLGGGTTNLHKKVLGSGLSCKICQKPLDSVAYRLCLTRCTPVNHVPDASMDDISEWCCSLDHAVQSAISIIEQLEEL